MIIDRPILLEHLYRFATAGNGILIGQPGSGKTYELKNLSKRLHEEGIPSFFITVDKLPIDTDRKLVYELGIERPDDPQFDIFSYLEEERLERGGSTGILIIDSLDAARSPSSQAYYLDFIRRCISRLEDKWHVIVSVRIYDAKKSPTLLNLFPSNNQISSPTPFTRDDIGCRHFWIPKLEDAEIEQAVLQIPSLSAVYDSASKEFKQLMKVPFNLWLIENLMLHKSADINYSAIQSDTHLLKQFWERRVIEGHLGESKQFVLTRITREMVNEQSLSIRKETVFDFSADGAWNQLLSTEVLEPSSNHQRISYSHNILFDYAVSMLLLEEDPDLFIIYLSECTSRPIFLRPSLTYFFTRLLIDQHETFWNFYWKIFPTEECHLRPFIQLLPTTTVAMEATSLTQLEPLIERLRDGKDDAKKAVLNIIRALISINAARKDALWLDFLCSLSPYFDEAFAWDLAVYLNTICDRAQEGENTEILQKCGKISRQLFAWIWEGREKGDRNYFDNLGGIWATYLVAKTFDTDAIASKNHLRAALSLLKTEKNFQIKYISRLTGETDKILESDPEFLKEIYFAVFEHEETSNETTSMGTPVLPLTSNRRQDYGLCTFHLTKGISKFIEKSPTIAAETIIGCLQDHSKRARSIEVPEDYFAFRGKEARYVCDISYVWDEGHYIDDTLKLADPLFNYIQKLAENGNTEKIDKILDVFGDHVRSAFFWRRLLRISAEYPDLFAERVFELCIAKPVLGHPETIYEVCQFIETAIDYFSPQQILQIETAILKLPDGEDEPLREILFERYVKRLIGRIPLDHLQTPNGRALRADMEKSNKIPGNNPTYAFHEATVEPYTQENWLTDQGVDIKTSDNQELLEYSHKVEPFVKQWQNKIPPIEDIRSIYDTAHDVYSKLKRSHDLDERTCNVVWTDLAQCIETMSRGVEDPDSIEFKFCRQVLLDCAIHEEPQHHPQYDNQFTSPAWSPAPRHSAAEGLPWLAARHKDAKVIEAIEQLTRDVVPSVRYLATRELFRIWFTCPEEFWRIMQDIAGSERNIVVQGAVCSNMRRFVKEDPERCVDVLNTLYKTISQTEGENTYPDEFLSMVTGFAIAFDNNWAKDLMLSFLTNCKKYHAETVKLIFESTIYLKPQNLEKSETKQIFNRSRDWLESTIPHIVKAIRELFTDYGNNLDKNSETIVTDLYRALDEIVTRIYFSAGIFEKGASKEQLSSDLQKEYYCSVKPIFLHFLDACERSHVAINPGTAHYFIELMNGVLRHDPPGVLDMSVRVIRASTPAGYSFDHMGMEKIVELCETIISDHKELLLNEASLKNLLDLLDIFVKAGWPKPLELVWRLDEIYR